MIAFNTKPRWRVPCALGRSGWMPAVEGTSAAGIRLGGDRERRVLMFTSLRATAWKVVLVVLVGGGLAAGVAMASSAGARATSPPTVDHQLCYSASGADAKIPSGVRLIRARTRPEGLCAENRSQGAVALQPGGEDPADRQGLPDHQPQCRLACFTITAGKASVTQCRGEQPVGEHDPCIRPAQPAMRGIVERSDWPA